MNDLTDDLLSDLDDLESSTEELTQKTNLAKNKHHTLEGLGSAQHIDSASLVLEAAKAAQEAATQSQRAAESAIKLSNDFKAQIIELSDSNASWRQTARSTSQDITNSRNAIMITMSVTVILGMVTTSLSAWFLYQNGKKQEMFKGEVLDLIQTENTLNNKGITLKVDQLSSLIEALSADIQSLKLPIHQTTSVKEPSQPSVEIVNLSDEIPAVEIKNTSIPATTDPHTTPETSETHLETESAAPDKHTNPVVHDHDAPTTQDNHLDTSLVPNPSLDTHRYEELTALVNLILDKQQKLEAAIMTQSQWLQKSQTIAAHPVINDDPKGMSDKQIKQLEGIGWLVRKQEKTLNDIQAALKVAKNHEPNKVNDQGIQNIEKSLNELKAQIANLSTQQKAIESQVIELQAQTQKLSEAPKPYSYQSK